MYAGLRREHGLALRYEYQPVSLEFPHVGKMEDRSMGPKPLPLTSLQLQGAIAMGSRLLITGLPQQEGLTPSPSAPQLFSV